MLSLQTELKTSQQQMVDRSHAKDEAEERLKSMMGEVGVIKQQVDRSNAEM